MKKRRWFFVVAGILTSLLVVQCSTFKMLAPGQMKNKLLGNAFLPDSLGFDTVFARGFTSADCFVGDPNSYFKIDLLPLEQHLKNKLRAKCVLFPERPNWASYDTARVIKEKVEYGGYCFYNKRTQPFIPCYMTLREYIAYSDGTQMKEWGHETDYIWLLFFYIPINEHKSAINY